MKAYGPGPYKDTTRVIGGETTKDSLVVQAYGAVDELNAAVGIAHRYAEEPDVQDMLRDAQRNLFSIGAELAGDKPRVADGDIAAVEALIRTCHAKLPPLRRFILPGGSLGASMLHLARTICRRAERNVVRLSREQPVSGSVLKYLNRLSDLLFVLARYENVKAGISETEWEHD